MEMKMWQKDYCMSMQSPLIVVGTIMCSGQDCSLSLKGNQLERCTVNLRLRKADLSKVN